MSYLANGTTLRSEFREMSPKGHHAEVEESEVLSHIAGKLGCDLERASRAFNSMRNPKSRVLVFDAMHRQWKGCDWTPTDQPSSQQMLRDNLRHIERKHSEIAKQKRNIEANMERLLARVERLEKMANEYGSSDSGDKPSKTVDAGKAHEALMKKCWQEA